MRPLTSETIPSPPAWVKLAPLKADTLLDALARGNPFTLSRWGDGEWYSVIGAKGQNSDRQVYHASLRDSLREVLSDRPDYYLGLRFPDQPRLRRQLCRWLKDNGLEDLQWYNAGLVWHDLVWYPGGVEKIFAALQNLPVVYVGPEHLRSLDRWIPYRAWVEVPLVDAWSQIERIVLETIREGDKLERPFVVGVSAGIAAKPLIHRLRHVYQDQAFLVDFGSVFDPYCGRKTRRYHRYSEFKKHVREFVNRSK